MTDFIVEFIKGSIVGVVWGFGWLLILDIWGYKIVKKNRYKLSCPTKGCSFKLESTGRPDILDYVMAEHVRNHIKER